MRTTYIIHSNFSILDQKPTERGAKIALVRKWLKRYPDAKVVSSDEFRNSDPIVEVKSLMSKQTVKIRLSQKGGCCDPSTETYWTM